MDLSVKDSEKYSYIESTPRSKVVFIFIFGLLSWLLVLWGFSSAIIYNDVYRYFIGPILIVLTINHFISFGINLFFKQLDLREHFDLVKKTLTTWKSSNSEPTVDIFLPICGENIEVLKNTWEHVRKLDYKNYRVFVLDDSKVNTEEHRKLAESFGFSHLERPNKGEMKKAGNLKYAYGLTKGEFIVIFDADFAPHKDFLNETLPYLIKDKKIGILQTPQFFDTTKEMHGRSIVEYGAGYVQEDFYRVFQVARSQFGGTICCGSNAVYRRSVLDMIGGMVQIEHSEDVYTGFVLRSLGWKVVYLPVILAKGLCPDDLHNYFHQQHRWCSGSMSMMTSKKFWQSNVGIMTKLCYISGFLFYLQQPLTILLSFQLFLSIFFFNDSISLFDAWPFYPFIVYAFIVMPLFRIPKYRLGSIFALFVQLYAYSHAVFTTLLGRSVGWIPTNTKVKGVSSVFNQTTILVGIYIFIYLLFVAAALRMENLQFFNYDYYSIQFWILWNLFFSSLLLHKMLEVIFEAEIRSMQKAPSLINKLAIGAKLYLPYILIYLLTLFVIGL